MASLSPNQITMMWSEGQCARYALYSIKNVDTGDTIDLSNHFRVIIQTAWLGATVSGVATGSFVGQTATAPSGLTDAGAYLLVQGVAV
jgi:hypothetical protein